MDRLCVFILHILCVIIFISLAGTQPNSSFEILFRVGVVLAWILSISSLIFGDVDEDN